MRNGHAQHRPNTNIVHIVSIVLAAGNSDQCSAEERSEGEKDAGEIGARAVNVALACNKKCKIAQTTEGETAMPTGETAPAIV